MRNRPTPSPRSRRRAWWLLELTAGLAVAAALLSQHVTRELLRAQAQRRRARRRMAYFLVRGLAAELPYSRHLGRYRGRPLASLRGLHRDRARLALSPALVGDLEALRLTLRRHSEGLVIEVHGPGVREARRVPWEV